MNAISPKESRNSNVEPSNSCVEALQTSLNVNCKDEAPEAPENDNTDTTMEEQSNDGMDAGIRWRQVYKLKIR